MSTKIKTTGDLREFLAMAILAVKNGDMKIDEASRITKLAAQINESFYSEIKISRVHREIGIESAPLGNLELGKTETV